MAKGVEGARQREGQARLGRALNGGNRVAPIPGAARRLEGNAHLGDVRNALLRLDERAAIPHWGIPAGWGPFTIDFSTMLRSFTSVYQFQDAETFARLTLRRLALAMEPATSPVGSTPMSRRRHCFPMQLASLPAAPWLRHFGETVLSLFYPPHCAACGAGTAAGVHLCAACADGARRLVAPFCYICSEPFVTLCKVEPVWQVAARLACSLIRLGGPLEKTSRGH
jgi:hypothetical protein